MKDTRIEIAITTMGFFGLLFVIAHWALTFLRLLQKGNTTVVYSPDGSKHYHQTVVYDLRDNNGKGGNSEI